MFRSITKPNLEGLDRIEWAELILSPLLKSSNSLFVIFNRFWINVLLLKLSNSLYVIFDRLILDKLIINTRTHIVDVISNI